MNFELNSMILQIEISLSEMKASPSAIKIIETHLLKKKGEKINHFFLDEVPFFLVMKFILPDMKFIILSVTKIIVLCDEIHSENQ